LGNCAGTHRDTSESLDLDLTLTLTPIGVLTATTSPINAASRRANATLTLTLALGLGLTLTPTEHSHSSCDTELSSPVLLPTPANPLTQAYGYPTKEGDAAMEAAGGDPAAALVTAFKQHVLMAGVPGDWKAWPKSAQGESGASRLERTSCMLMFPSSLWCRMHIDGRKDVLVSQHTISTPCKRLPSVSRWGYRC